jgi:hypothetical protein
MAIRARSIIKLAALLLPLALGGCLSSKQPLFDETGAVLPLAEGKYGAYERSSGIRFKQTDTVTVKRNGQGYDFTMANGHTHRVTFHAVGKTIIGQAKTDSNDYVYMQAEPRGGTILLRTADCGKQDQGKLAALGAKISGTDCRLDNVKDAKTLFSTLRFGRSTAKLIKK